MAVSLMRPHRILVLLFFAALAIRAADRKHYNEVGGPTVELTAKLYMDPDAIKQLVGSDLGGHYVVVQMTVKPIGPKPVNVQAEDFQIFSEADGDRTKPQTPAEITAADSMVLKRGSSGIGSLGEESGTRWSGVGFGGGTGRKKKEDDKDAKSTPAVKKGASDPALRKVLTEKALPEKETAEPVTGLLYFPIEKKKMKDLALFYSTPDGKLRMYFK